MSGMITAAHSWSTQVVLLDTPGDYVEWTVTLNSTQAAAMNQAFSFNRHDEMRFRDLADYYVTVNGYEAGRNATASPHIDFHVSGDFANDLITIFTNIDDGTTVFGVAPPVLIPVWIAGTNRVRLYRGQDSVQGVGHNLELDCIMFDTTNTAFGDTYTGTLGNGTGVGQYGQSVPPWYAAHTNPGGFVGTTQNDYVPEFVLKATDATFGHADGPVSIEIAGIVTSASLPITGLAYGYVDVTFLVTGVHGTINDGIVYVSWNYYDEFGPLKVYSSAPVVGGLATLTLANLQPNGSDPTAANFPAYGGGAVDLPSNLQYGGGGNSRSANGPAPGPLIVVIDNPSYSLEQSSPSRLQRTFTVHSQGDRLVSDSFPQEDITVFPTSFGGTWHINNGRIDSYAWDFGDTGTSTAASPTTHTYAHGGDYHVVVQLFGGFGALGAVEY